MISSLGNAGRAAKLTFDKSKELATQLLNSTNTTDYDYQELFNSSDYQGYIVFDTTTEAWLITANDSELYETISSTSAAIIEEGKENVSNYGFSIAVNFFFMQLYKSILDFKNRDSYEKLYLKDIVVFST